MRIGRVADSTASVADYRRNQNLTVELREKTSDLHKAAERSGIIQDLLTGKATKRGYTILLRNLLPAYQALEAGLSSHSESTGVRWIVYPEVYRSAALEADLKAIAGPGWKTDVPLLTAGDDYGRSVRAAGLGDGIRLVAHGYTRYLGDLSGGQILKRILKRSMALRDHQLTFYDFPELQAYGTFKDEFRTALDAAASEISDWSSVLDEARSAFRSNIRVSIAAARAAAEVDGEAISPSHFARV